MLGNEPCQINGNGEQTRDFVYVSDVVTANLAALESEEMGTFNVGTAVETNINELADLMKEISGSTSEISHTEAKPGEQMNSSLSFDHAKQVIGWVPQVTIKEGLEKTINYFKNAS